MKLFAKKLKSESGASIVLALVFFLICITIGGIILTSATGNAGSIHSMKSEQQAYFTVYSAAETIRSDIKEMKFSAIKTTVHNEGNTGGTNYSSVVDKPKNGIFKDFAGDGCERLFHLQYTNSGNLVKETNIDEELLSEHEYLITTDDTLAMESVTAQFNIDKEYNIIVKLFITPPEDGSSYNDYPVTLTMKADVIDVPVSTSHEQNSHRSGNDEDGNPIMDTYTVTTKEKNVAVSWTAGKIDKGVL